MKIIDEGHKYILETFDDTSQLMVQPLVYMQRTGDYYPGNKTKYPGTNMQEVIRTLIDRIIYVNNQHSHYTNDLFLRLQRNSLLLLELRAAEVHNLLNSFGMKLLTQSNIESLSSCKHCGHIVCKEFIL